MNIIDLVRLLRKHIVLLIAAPLVLASLVIFMTRKPVYKYASETKIYTGIATGSSVELDKSLNYFASNTTFENLISVIKSRQTQQEVSIKLLAQHLMLGKADPKYISQSSFDELKRITPAYVLNLVEKNDSPAVQPTTPADSAVVDSLKKDSFSFNDLVNLNNPVPLPPSIDQAAYDHTVQNLTDLMTSSDTNFVYKLLNFVHPHYSIKALSAINVQRMGTSDLVQLKYETDDPGVCQQTLVLMIGTCIKNYKNIKENRSDAVVKYFEFQLKEAGGRLNIAEDKLLQFNKDNNIINYYEQSKAVAVTKEALDVDYHNRRIKLAGIEAAIDGLEEKLTNQQQIQLKSSGIIEKRNELGEINYKIAYADMIQNADTVGNTDLSRLKLQADRLKEELRLAVADLYKLGNSIEGIPVNTLLTDWISNVVEAENLKAEINVLGDRIKEFQKQYDIYAPAGANLKRIEREIGVSEQEYLEILHGLNLAKLKQQDNELSSNLKVVDQPFFALSPIPTKRKILIIMAAMAGFVIVLGSIFVTEYFDDTLKNQKKASSVLKLSCLGILPKILLKAGNLNFPYIINRLLETSVQNTELLMKDDQTEKSTRTILVFSTLNNEGKTVVAGNLALNYRKKGGKVLVLNFSPGSLKSQAGLTGYQEGPSSTDILEPVKQRTKFSVIRWLLGYPDNRTDPDSPFLEDPGNYLAKDEYLFYNVDQSFYSAENYRQILEKNDYKLAFVPDYVFIELPPVLYFPYPASLFKNADLPLLVCRSNRVWTSADQGVLETLLKLAGSKIHFFLNGVDLPVIESVLGDLPKERSWLRKSVKKLFRLQFTSQSQI
jgi:polysaccharide biosynthesis transport protein